MVFQTFGLLPWKTAIENVELPMEVAGIEKAEAKSRADRYLKMVGLGMFENAYPHDCSGGMRQRIGVALGRWLSGPRSFSSTSPSPPSTSSRPSPSASSSSRSGETLRCPRTTSSWSRTT